MLLVGRFLFQHQFDVFCTHFFGLVFWFYPFYSLHTEMEHVWSSEKKMLNALNREQHQQKQRAHTLIHSHTEKRMCNFIFTQHVCMCVWQYLRFHATHISFHFILLHEACFGEWSICVGVSNENGFSNDPIRFQMAATFCLYKKRHMPTTTAPSLSV